MMIPQPDFLRTPPRKGMPTPEERRKYMSYLLYQLRRGPIPRGGDRYDHGIGEFRSNTVSDRQLLVLKTVRDCPMTTAQLATVIGKSLDSTKETVYGMVSRGLVQRLDEKAGKFRYYTTTEDGERMLETARANGKVC